MALDSISDYVSQARILTQDTVQPFRYPDADLVLAFNTGLMESRRLRPDMWIGVSSVPSFKYGQTNAVTNSGNTTLNFASGAAPAAVIGDLIWDVTNPLAISSSITVQSATGSSIVLTGPTAQAVGSGDLIVTITPSLMPSIDQQYRMAFVYYMIGQAQMRDEEETQDTRAATFMGMFNRIMTGAIAA